MILHNIITALIVTFCIMGITYIIEATKDKVMFITIPIVIFIAFMIVISQCTIEFSW